MFTQNPQQASRRAKNQSVAEDFRIRRRIIFTYVSVPAYLPISVATDMSNGEIDADVLRTCHTIYHEDRSVFDGGNIPITQTG